MTKLELLETLGTVDEKYLRDAQRLLLPPDKQQPEDPFAVRYGVSEETAKQKKGIGLEKLGHIAVAAAISAIFITAGVILHRNADVFRAANSAAPAASTAAEVSDAEIRQNARNFLGGRGELTVVTGAGMVNVLEDRDYWYIGTQRAAKNIANPDGSYMLEPICTAEGCNHEGNGCPQYMAEHIDCEGGEIWMYSDDGTMLYRLNADGSYAETVSIRRLLDLYYNASAAGYAEYGGRDGGGSGIRQYSFPAEEYMDPATMEMTKGCPVQVTKGIVPGEVNVIKRQQTDVSYRSIYAEAQDLMLLTVWMLDADDSMQVQDALYGNKGTDVDSLFHPVQHILVWNRTKNEVYEIVPQEKLTRPLTSDDVFMGNGPFLRIRNDLTLLTDEDWAQYSNEGYLPESLPDTLYPDMESASEALKEVGAENYPTAELYCYLDGVAFESENQSYVVYGQDGTVIDRSDSGEASVRRRLYAGVLSTGTRGRIMKGTGSSWHNECDPMWIGTDGALWKEADYIHYNAVNPEWTPDGFECDGYRLEIRYAARSNSNWTDFTELDGINYAIAGDTLVWNNSTGFSEIPLTDGVAGYELETADNRTALLLHKDGRYLLVNAGTGEVKIFQ